MHNATSWAIHSWCSSRSSMLSKSDVVSTRPRRSRSLRTFFAPNLGNGTRWERERSQPDQRSHEFVLRESAAPSVMPQITAKKALLGVHETT